MSLVMERWRLEQITEERRVVQQRHIGEVHLAVSLEIGELLAEQDHAVVDARPVHPGVTAHLAPHLDPCLQRHLGRAVLLHPLISNGLVDLLLGHGEEIGQTHLAEGLVHDRSGLLPEQTEQHVLVEAQVVDHAGVHAHEITRNVVPCFFVAKGKGQQLAEHHMEVGLEPPDDAPIQQGDAAVAQHHDVACVDVTVEEGAPYGGDEPRFDGLFHDRAGIDPELLDPRHVVHGHAVEKLHGQDAATRQLVDRLGHHDEPDVGSGRQPTEVVHDGGLVAEVELFGELQAKPLEDVGERSGDVGSEQDAQ